VSKVLATDAHERSMLAVIRCMGTAGYEVTATAPVRIAPGLWSRHISSRRIVPDPTVNIEAFTAAMEQLVSSEAHDLLIPGTDATLLAVSRRRQRLEPFVRLGLPDHEVVEAVLDRALVGERAAAAGLAPPDSRLCANAAEAVEAARELGYPVVVKPVRTVVEANGHLTRYASRMADGDPALHATVGRLEAPYLVQRCEPGPLLSFAGVATGGGLLGSVVARYRRTWPPPAGSVTFSETVTAPPMLVERVESLVASLGWQGIFELELIERSPDSFAAIDFNPRPYGSQALARAAGVPLAEMLCSWLLGDQPAPASSRPGARYRWEDSDIRHAAWQIRHHHYRLAAAALAPRRRVTHAFFDRRDPLPAFARAAELVRKAARRARGQRARV
jgi:predicted ATP-grasp superfamily ATP-dependent carboligase